MSADAAPAKKPAPPKALTHFIPKIERAAQALCSAEWTSGACRIEFVDCSACLNVYEQKFITSAA